MRKSGLIFSAILAVNDVCILLQKIFEESCYIPDISEPEEGPFRHGFQRLEPIEILQNEQYCGDVISWKTYTYDYLNHKTKKNRGVRSRKKQVNHHEAIVSHEVWKAAQKMQV